MSSGEIPVFDQQRDRTQARRLTNDQQKLSTAGPQRWCESDAYRGRRPNGPGFSNNLDSWGRARYVELGMFTAIFPVDKRDGLAIRRSLFFPERFRVGVPQSTIGALETGEHKTARNIAEIAAVLSVETLWLSSGKGPKRMDGTLSYVDHGIPPHVLALAERLALIPDEKLKAVSVLLGIKL